MPDAEGPVEEGWGWPGGSRKAHRVVDCRILCDGTPFYGELSDMAYPEPNTCQGCRAALAVRVEGHPHAGR